MELNLLYVHGTSLGYGRYGVYLAKELSNLGVDVYDHLPGPGAEHLQGYRSGICNVAAWVSVPTHARGWYRGQVPVISTMWEASRLPESFRETLHEFDTVIVPSHHNVELFSQYNKNVHFVPLGVDPDLWCYQPRPPADLFFNFMCAGSGTRKGPDLVHKAFRKLWPRDGSWEKEGPIPRLLLKNPRNENFYGDRIDIISGRISDEAEVALYGQAHCYVQPSRGEGFGLQPLQAMAQGCPTILTAAHGHDAFAHLGYGLSSTMVPSAYFIYGDAGEWWEPNFDELCERMEWVYNNYEQACQDAQLASQTIHSTLTWKHTAQGFIDAIGRDRLLRPFSGSEEWYEPEAKQYLVRINKPWKAEAAGFTYMFEPGRDYWEPADTKRILFEADLLDPSCLSRTQYGNTDNILDWDVGLSPEQLERIPDYSARMAYCPTCNQRLNTVPTHSDDIFNGLVE